MTVLNKEFIDSLFNLLSKQKKMPAIINNNGEIGFAEISFDNKNFYLEDIFKKSATSKIAFLFNGYIYMLESELTEFNNKMKGNMPDTLLISYESIYDRVKTDTVLNINQTRYNLIDIGIKGFTFSTSEKVFLFNEKIIAEFNLNGKVIKIGAIIDIVNKISDSKVVYEARIICACKKDYDELLNYIFLKTNPISEINQHDIIALYKKYNDRLNTVALNDNIELSLNLFNVENRSYPLTYPQQGMWNIEQVYPDTSLGIISGSILSKDKMDFSVLERAINKCIETNDSFRLKISLIDSEPMQYISKYTYKKIDFKSFGNESLYKKWTETQSNRPFDLVESDLYYFAMFEIEDGKSGLYFKHHHLISDAWTVIIMTNQIMEVYVKLLEGGISENEEGLSYREFIAKENDYLCSKAYWKNKQFWDEKFSTLPKFNLLKPYASNSSVKAIRKTFTLSKEMAQKINDFCGMFKTTPYTLFMSILALYLYKFTSKDDIVIGSPILNRSNAREKLITGMFINIIPLRFDIKYDVSFADFIGLIGKQIMQYLRNQKYPYDLLLQDFKKKHKSDKLYDVVLSYQNSKLNEGIVSENIQYSWNFSGSQTESLCIHVDDRDRSGGYVINLDYLENEFEEKEIESIFEHILNLLNNAVSKPENKLAEMQMLSENELDCVLNKFNSNSVKVPENVFLHKVFEQIAAKNPNKKAVICDGKEMTYAELNSKSNRLARLLRKKEVKRESIVGIMLNRSVDVAVAVLAILKAGGAYLPIDPNYPEDRVKYIIKNSELKIMITDRDVCNDNFNCEKINIDDIIDTDIIDTNLENINYPSDLIYVIYTSGSTGDPKGVMIEHGSFMNIAYGWRKEYNLEDGEFVLLQLASFSFDVFAGDMARAFLNGGTMVIASQEERYSFPKLYNLIDKYKISLLETTPQLVFPLMEYIYNNGLKVDNLKLLIIGSDVCLNKEYKMLMQRFGHNMRIINSYGVTEACVDSSYYEALEKDIPQTGTTPIGKPFGNSKFYVLGDNFEIKPIGVIGELYISGKCVARGYYKKEELTAERFFDSPFIKGERLYKTGDLAKWLPDGNMAFLGRMDTQVKVRGFRIELSEIENKILMAEGIKDAVVAVENNTIFAFFVSDVEIDISDLKEHLFKSLPNYMVPSRFARLDSLPLTPNGKVDKKAILKNYLIDEIKADYVAPENDIQSMLCDMWAEALGREKVGILDNFFEIGGDSLAAISILSLAYNEKWRLSIQDFYKYQTVREMAEAIVIGKENRPEDNIQISEVAFKHSESDFSVTKDYYKAKNILLTGATGFLGVHILHELLKTSANVYCLIRGEKQKLFDTYKFYFSDCDDINKRVYLVKGDISKQRFGLANNDYKNLIEKIDTVIHSAAVVRHYGMDDEFNKINIFGTEEIIDFCKRGNIRLIHISTTSVSGDTLKQEKAISYCENDFYIGQNYKDNIYIKSKFVSENLVLKAINEDLDATIFRVGNLTGRLFDGVFQKNIQDNMFYNMIKAIITMGAIPQEINDEKIEMTPVDLCAKAITELVKIKESNKRVFHVFNDNRVKIGYLINGLNFLGYSIKKMQRNDFLEYVDNKDKKTDDSSLFLVNDYNFDKITDEKYNVNVSAELTNKYLHELNFNWNYIDEEYIKKLVKFMENSSFI